MSFCTRVRTEGDSACTLPNGHDGDCELKSLLVKVVKVSLNGWGPYVVKRSPNTLGHELETFLDEGGEGDELSLKLTKMPHHEFDNLPEHEGW